MKILSSYVRIFLVLKLLLLQSTMVIENEKRFLFATMSAAVRKLVVRLECTIVCLLILLNLSSVTCFHLRYSPPPQSSVSSKNIVSSRRRSGTRPLGGAGSRSTRTTSEHFALPPPHQDLPSSFPPEFPAGLRGEAVRRALLSRCIAWNFQDSPLVEWGVVRVQGPGCRTFLHNKLTPSFFKDDNNPAASLQKTRDPTVVTVGSYRTACLLNARGRVVDLLGVVQLSDDCAFLITSPGHSSKDLLDRLDPFVFPLDQVTLTDCTTTTTSGDEASSSSSSSSTWTLASAHRSHVQSTFDQFIAPRLPLLGGSGGSLPDTDATAVYIPLDTDGGVVKGSSFLLITPARNQLPSFAAAAAYSFVWVGTTTLGHDLWDRLVAAESEPTGQRPIHVGPLEWDTLRIEAGHPAFGRELTGRDTTPTNNAKASASTTATAASPLELHLEGTLAPDKGCYLGQEGVASILKNPRGPPRTLYQVVFHDEFNRYDENDDDEDGDDATKGCESDPRARPPQLGDPLFVLGSNQAIAVGTLTSVAEPGGTGEAHTLGLALVRRADSILKQMDGLGLEISHSRGDDSLEAQTLHIPLEGLEVIVGDTFTVGVLVAVPGLRFLPHQNMFVDEPSAVPVQLTNSVRIEIDPQEVARVLEEAQKAEAEAEAAAAKAKLKEEKIEMLRKRAEEAMARRRNKQQAIDGS